jgi:hypothetical protein
MESRREEDGQKLGLVAKFGQGDEPEGDQKSVHAAPWFFPKIDALRQRALTR